MLRGKWIIKYFYTNKYLEIKDDGTLLLLYNRLMNIAITEKEKNKLRKLYNKINSFLISSYKIAVDKEKDMAELKRNWKWDERTFLTQGELTYRKKRKTIPGIGKDSEE